MQFLPEGTQHTPLPQLEAKTLSTSDTFPGEILNDLMKLLSVSAVQGRERVGNNTVFHIPATQEQIEQVATRIESGQ